MLGEKKNKTQNLSNWKAEKQYKAKWNMENLEKSQRPAIKKASVWNGLVIHMPTAGLGQSVSWSLLQLRWAMIF